MKLTRTILPAALAAAMLLMTACSAGSNTPTQDASGEECLPSGAVSDAIKFSGTIGEDLEITSKLPIKVTEAERTVLKAGKGEVIQDGDTANVALTMINGRTGEILSQVPESPIPFVKEQLAPIDADLLRCGVAGEESVTVQPFDAVFGEDIDEAMLGETFKKGDAIIMATKFGEITAGDGDGAADGANADAVVCETTTKRDKKYPEVDLGDGKSEPKITIPECMEAPEELELKVLKEGTGAVVADGDTVMTNYIGVDWNGAERFDGNWSEEGIPFPTGGVIEGFKQAMVGQKIGSIIQVTMPSELGYNDGMTRTFVLELVGEAK